MGLTARGVNGYEAGAHRHGARVPVINPPDPLDREPQTTSNRIGKGLLEAIDGIAKDAGLSRNETINQMLKWALRAHLEEKKGSRK
jgi:hypothetical protein